MPTLAEIPKADPRRQCPSGGCSHDFRTRLSLTRELLSGGCAHYYMKSAFPNLASYVTSLKLPNGNLLAEAPKGWESFMGTSFDRRLRYEYEPDCTDDVLERGAQMLFSLNGYEVSEGLTHQDLNVRSLYAALADTTFRNPTAGGDRCVALSTGTPELRRNLIADLQALLEIARKRLRLSSPRFGPTFGLASYWIGGAEADLIDNGCLIDVKCVKNIIATAFVGQTIAYALLEVDNEHRLDSVGIYLALQGILWEIPLADVVGQGNMTLEDLRAQAPWGNPTDLRNLETLVRQSGGKLFESLV